MEFDLELMRTGAIVFSREFLNAGIKEARTCAAFTMTPVKEFDLKAHEGDPPRTTDAAM